jgi:DNA-binding MarR family transcriptional regulator
MTNRLDQLEKAGLVRRLPDPDDRRALLVELTKKGHKLWAESISAQADKEAALAAALDGRELAQLNKLLRKVLAGFEEPG